jgi:gamma-glutamyltranspeptidase/glutathione hydrolase
MGIRDAFCLFYDAKTKTVQALNGSGRAPADLDIDYALSRGHKYRIPLTDLNSVTVPGQHMFVFLAQLVLTFFTGAAAAWIDTIQHFGSNSVSVAEIFDPAIRLAEEGYAYIIPCRVQKFMMNQGSCL